MLRRRTGRERPLGTVPGWVWGALLVGLAAQVGFHAWTLDRLAAKPEPLPRPPPAGWLRIAGLGDGIVVARLTMIWLQAFDNQPGISLPLHSLDYERVEGWLDVALDLDPRSHYPLLVATRIYGSVADEARVRRMLEFAYRRFLEAPDARWRWLAHAAIMAKHRLRDLDLALRYARAITEHARGPDVPPWARDLTVIVLAEMGEHDAAMGLIGALLASGQITDPHEARFLADKAREIEAMREADQ